MDFCRFLILLVGISTSSAFNETEEEEWERFSLQPPYLTSKEAPFGCGGTTGRFPDPYNCRNSYICENIVQIKHKTPCPSGSRLNTWGECVAITKVCQCPFGTFWGGPEAECISDKDDMKACCDFKATCIIWGGNFGRNCSLTKIGYYYLCSGVNGLGIRVHRCTGRGEIFKVWTSCKLPSNSTNVEEMNPDKETNKMPVCESSRPVTTKVEEMNSDNKTIKILPVCKTVRHVTNGIAPK